MKPIEKFIIGSLLLGGGIVDGNILVALAGACLALGDVLAFIITGNRETTS